METNQFLETQMTHVFYTFGDNEAKLYINGKLVKNIKVQGNLSNWDNDYLFFIGNESTGNRPWLGSIYSLSLYKEVISKAEINRKFNAGISQKGEVAVKDNDNHYRFFERQVAPLLANHCLECHDLSLIHI